MRTPAHSVKSGVADSRGDRLRLSIVVPFHRNLLQLRQCLVAIRAAAQLVRGADVAELIVVADGAVDDPRELAAQAGARVIAIAGPRGPAVARNRGVDAAIGDVIVFVDTDVVARESAFDALARHLATRPDVGAVFGAYDDTPADPGFLSQCRNLGHSFVHRRSAGEASTFWAGLGAVRRDLFQSIGGFDERFPRPSVEDLELGYRVRMAGFKVWLDPSIQGTHLKRWTFRNSVVTDVRDRGIPWTQLIHRYGGQHQTLNVTTAYRLCVVVAYVAVGALIAAWWWPLSLALVATCLVALGLLDRAFYGFFRSQRGLGFTLRWFPFHVLHHLCNGVSFGVGTVLWWARRAGVTLPWSLPVTPWTRSERSLREPAA
jgi:GT2 family glycosyltransferase